MKRIRLSWLAYLSVALVLGTAAFALSARPASADVDATGEWSAAYSLSCSATFTQSGMSVTGSVDCGADIAVDVTGTFEMNHLTLNGDFVGIPVMIEGDLASDGRTLQGTWSAPPLVTEGPFEATRQGSPSTMNVTGMWDVDVLNIFSGTCTVSIDQSGDDLSADVDCAGGPSGTFEGTIDRETGAATLGGPFSEFTSLEMMITVADDGDSFEGTWFIAPVGPGGVVRGERIGGGPDEESPTRPRSRATATPAALPETGAGGPAGGSDWAYAAIAGALALSAGSYVVLRRLR
jgi:hypothetical protein